MRTSIVSPALAFALTATLTACGGGGTPGAPALPSTPVKSASSVSIKITIPSTALSSSARTPHFVSPSIKSASVQITPNGGCSGCSSAVTSNVALTSSSPNCSTVAGALTCTVSLILNPGSYTGSMTTYDGALSGGNPSGNVLSLNSSFPVPVVASTANNVPLTLNGVPTSITIVPADTTISTPLVNTYAHVVNNTADAPYSIVAKDAGGNIIVGSGAPSYSVALTCSSCAGSYGATVSGSTLHLSSGDILYTGANTSTAQVAITASSPACSASNAVCALNFNLKLAQQMAILGTSSIAVWNAGTTAAPVFVTNGINGPTDLKFDTSGNLWVANAGNSTVTQYVPPFSGTSVPAVTVSNGINAPRRLFLEYGTNKLFVANSNSVTVYSSPWTAAPDATIIDHISQPVDLGMEYAATHRLFVANYAGSAITAYDAPYTGVAVQNVTGGSTGINQPESLLVYNDGSFWAGNHGNSTVVHYGAPPYTASPSITIISSASAPLVDPISVKTDPSGGVMVADDSAGAVFRYSSAGSFISKMGTGWNAPSDTEMQNDGNIWVADGFQKSLSAFAPPYSSTAGYDVYTNASITGATRMSLFP